MLIHFYEIVYLPLCKVTYTAVHIQGDEMSAMFSAMSVSDHRPHDHNLSKSD